MRSSLHKRRLLLVLLGVGLGYAARLVFGGPSVAPQNGFEFTTPPPAQQQTVPEAEEIDLPLLDDGADDIGESGGLVPPIQVPGLMPSLDASAAIEQVTVQQAATLFDQFAHDANASFHAHGEQLCASGCAASRHPTKKLSRDHFLELMKYYQVEPMDQTNNALEELLYFGPQTRQMIEKEGFQGLSRQRAEFLWEELKKTHARISIRVVDEHGQVRTWLEPTSVPFDRRHVFEMETLNLQPLVTSGTVKRVGLNHLWTRL